MPEGSGLPVSLEKDVPPDLRYWTETDAETAKSVRLALVESGIPSEIRKVDGEWRRVVSKLFLAEESPEPAPLRKALSPALAAAQFTKAAAPVTTYEVLADDPVKDLVAKSLVAGPWVASYQDAPEVRKAASERALTSYMVKTRPGLLFVTNAELDTSPLVEVVQAPVETEKRDVRLLVSKAEGEERYVLGVVLEPSVVDAQKDTYTAEEIRKAAFGFLETHFRVGTQHGQIVGGVGEDVRPTSRIADVADTSKVRIVESYIAPVDFKVGAEEVRKGTWLLGVRVVDDAIWKAVKDGSFTGFSIGGSAVRTPAE